MLLTVVSLNATKSYSGIQDKHKLVVVFVTELVKVYKSCRSKVLMVVCSPKVKVAIVIVFVVCAWGRGFEGNYKISNMQSLILCQS